MRPPETVVNYLVGGIEATPVILAALLSKRDRTDPMWDDRPDPERFTLREVMAHLADWDPIFLDRVVRMVCEDHPFLPSIDESVICAERNYDLQDPLANLERLKLSRPELVAALRVLPADDWERTGTRELVGALDLFQLMSMILSHDSYHIKQVAERVNP